MNRIQRPARWMTAKIKWKYTKPELLQRLRDLKDNLKYLPDGGYPNNKTQ